MAAKSFGKLTRGMIQVIYTHIMEYVLKFMKRLVNSRIVSFGAIRVQGERYQASVSLSRQTKAAKSFIYVYRAGLWRYMSIYWMWSDRKKFKFTVYIKRK